MKKVMLDPGHGGVFSGAHCEDAIEKRIVLRVAIHLKRLLEVQGMEVSMTRDGDFHLSTVLSEDLQERCNLEHQVRPDCFVSIHCNAHDNKNAKGFEVWTSPGQTSSDNLATMISRSADSYVPEFAARKDMSDGDPDKESRFKVLVGTRGCAVLVELGFLSNEHDREFLLSTEGQFEFAKMLASAIYQYLKAEG